MTVDNPHTVEGLLNRILPDAEVKMDAGHVLFSRLGKKLDQQHALYGESNRELCHLPCVNPHTVIEQLLGLLGGSVPARPEPVNVTLAFAEPLKPLLTHVLPTAY